MANKNTFVGDRVKHLQLMAIMNTYMLVSIEDDSGNQIGGRKIADFNWNAQGRMELRSSIDFAAPANSKIRGIRIYEDGTLIHTHPVVVNIGASNTIYTISRLDVSI